MALLMRDGPNFVRAVPNGWVQSQNSGNGLGYMGN